jgi:hypothetical protein
MLQGEREARRPALAARREPVLAADERDDWKEF